MSTVFSRCAPATGAKTGYTPLLAGAAPLKHYRRSTTNKAPRKRSFIAQMTKFDANLITPPGVTCVFANNVAMLSGNTCRYEDAFGGDAGNNGGNFGNNNNGNNNNSNGGQGGFGGDAPRVPAILLGQALLGALALTVAVAAFPAHSTAASGLLGRSRAAAAAAPRPRSKVMHVATKGGTLVVPLPANAEAAPAPRSVRAKIVDAPIELTGREASILDGRQYRVRESMLV